MFIFDVFYCEAELEYIKRDPHEKYIVVYDGLVQFCGDYTDCLEKIEKTSCLSILKML